MNPESLEVLLTIPKGREDEVAREFLGRATSHQWTAMVQFALAVVCLEEAIRSGAEVQYLLFPVAQLAAVK